MATGAEEETASTTSVLRVMNERAVFERIRQLGPVSRPQLAEATGLSKPTISLALANLERSGLVRDVGLRTGNAGRAALLYEMRPDAGWVIGVDVGRAWLRLALANLAGEVVQRREERAHSRAAHTLVAQIGELVGGLAAGAGLSYGDITYTVIGSPGVFAQNSSRMQLAPNLPGWNRPGVIEALRDTLGSRFTVDNDINLAALGEQAYGRGKGISNFVFVSVGTGIGMGIVIDGRLYRGSRGAAGEISFLPLGEIDPSTATPGERRRGLLESAASADGVVAIARRLGMPGRLNAKQIFEAARRGDATAQAVVRVEVEQLARAVAAIASVLDPELVVFGGGVGRNGDLLIAPLEERLRELLGLEPPALVVSALGDDAVVLGALATALAMGRDLVLRRALDG